ncbi:MAG: YbaB/EbfC family nucleoid-associated protein [Planctomycetota bacterium]|nr:MAG: YbaB/EbfC family nucleoid-associated protein [Planctomycetota bacterium]
MAGSLGDLGGLLRQAQKMQRQMAELQEDLAQRKFEASSGGGAVKVTVSGARQVIALSINPEVVDPEDTELLEDLVMTAITDALKQAEVVSSQEMQALSGGMGIPGLM